MDRSPEARAVHFFQRGLYSEALQAYTVYLGTLPKNCKPEQHITVLFNRSACYLKLKQFHKVVEDCNLILQIDNKHEKALGRKIKAMCSLGQFSEAQSLAHQWIHRDPTNHQARKELERLNVIVKALSEQDNEEDLEMGGTVKVSPQHRDHINLSQKPQTPQHNHSTELPSSNSQWSVSSPIRGSGSRPPESKIYGVDKIWGGLVEPGLNNRSIDRWNKQVGGGLGGGGIGDVGSEGENNWGVAINTNWDEEHSDTLKASVNRGSFSATGNSNSSSNRIMGRNVESSPVHDEKNLLVRTEAGVPVSDNTSLVWSTNILTGSSSVTSPQSLPKTKQSKQQTESEALKAVVMQGSHGKPDIMSEGNNTPPNSVMNGRNSTSKQYNFAHLQTQVPGNIPTQGLDEEVKAGEVKGSDTDILGNGSMAKTLDHGLSSLWKDPAENDYSSLWNESDPFYSRQKDQSPPWEFSDKKKSRFSFANEEESLNFETFVMPDLLDEKAKDESTSKSNAPGAGFQPVSVVDSFSKSLVSPSTTQGSLTRCSVAGIFHNGSTAMSSTDKLFLQHMQRNTGGHSTTNSSASPLGQIQTNNFTTPTSPPAHKAPGHTFGGEVQGESSSSLLLDLDSEEEGEGENKDDLIQEAGDHGGSGHQTKPAIPQAFIPHVVQTQMRIGSAKQDTVVPPVSRKQPSVYVEEELHPQKHKPLPTVDEKCVDDTLASSLQSLVVSSSEQKEKQTAEKTGDKTEGDKRGGIAPGSAETTETPHTQTEADKTAADDTSLDSSVAEDAIPRVWKWRPPPRGLTSQEYTRCPRFEEFGLCSFGDNCSHAHSDEELCEWRERFEERKKELLRQKEEAQDGSSYIERLMEKLMKTQNQETVMCENVEHVNVHANYKLSIQTPSKKYSHTWLFTITSKMLLKKLVLIDDNHRSHFHIASITCGSKKAKKNQKLIKLSDQCQDWDNTEYKAGRMGLEQVYRVKVSFSTEIFGTFRQSVVCDFGQEPVLVRQLCVDSCPVTDLHQLTKHLTLSHSGRWDVSNVSVVDFSPKVFTQNEEELLLLETYPVPTAAKVAALSEKLIEPTLTRDNYRDWMHNLLSIEEIAQFSSISKFNVTTELQLVRSFMLMPNTVTTAKYAQNGELFARMEFSSVLSEDTAEGRLVLQNVYTVFIGPSPGKGEDKNKQPDKVYEALIEEKGKNFVFLRLSQTCVNNLSLKEDQTLKAQVQFQLNRMPMCEMHQSVDELPDVDTIFPSPQSLANPPWTQDQLRQVTFEESKLNEKQREAIAAITLKSSGRVSPILLVGPYGTGKTYTLAQAAKEILKQEGTRILICTHSNSAADLYIKDYFHPYIADGHTEALPLRVYYRHRWVQTVNAVTLQYCLTRVDPKMGTVFVNPTLEDVEKRRIVVTTFSTARQLFHLDLPEGFFTHILLDEAAQALECETITPLVLASEKTRVVLAGDHMQLSPEVHSEFASDRSFQMSLLERLYHFYPQTYVCKIMLCENYRSHKAIVDLTSELFYNSHLRACGSQSVHGKFPPLTFFTARGEDSQHQNSTGFFNNAEVYEIVDRVAEVARTWPKAWGPLDESSIGVVSPYTDQVIRIRAELRKKKLHSVCVERVFNVQGKQFRAMFLSTVRTRHTCQADASHEEYMDYGFLSNVKLLNTAITRAQSLVAVVGDPVALCSIGKCRKLWERLISLCDGSNSLHGMAWTYLRAQLDGVELKKTYILNPLAPEFVPNRLRHSQYTAPEPIAYGKYGYAFAPSNVGAPAPPVGGVQNMPWMPGFQRPPVQSVLMPEVPAVPVNPAALQYLNMLQAGGAVDPQTLLPFLVPPSFQAPARHESTPPNVQQPWPNHQQQQARLSSPQPASGRLPRSTTGKPEEARPSGSGLQEKNPSSTNHVLPRGGEVGGGGNQTDAALTAAQMRGQTLHHMPSPPMPPPPPPPSMLPPPPAQQQQLQQQQQILNQQAYNRAAEAMRFNPFLLPMAAMAAARYQTYIPPTPPFNQAAATLLNRSPPFMPVMGLRGAGGPGGAGLGGFPAQQAHGGGNIDQNQSAQPPQPFMPPNVLPWEVRKNFHHPNGKANKGLFPQNRNLHSPNFSSGSSMSTRSGSLSPSRTGRPLTPKMEFLPKAVNVRSPQSSVQQDNTTRSLTPQREVDSGPSRVRAYMNQASRNPFLQRELYGYIYQTEGQVAADRFASSQSLLQQKHQEQQQQNGSNDNHKPHRDNRLAADFLSPGFYASGQATSSSSSMGDGPPPQGLSNQFMAEDLERQWQEESMREQHSQSMGDIIRMTREEYKRKRGLKREDDKIIYNPNFEAISEKFLQPKRKSPFGEGPQPYSRLKVLGDARNKESATNEARRGPNASSEDLDGLTSPLSVEVTEGILEKELGQLHIDSPVDVGNMSPASQLEQRKMPLYMRRVQVTASSGMPVQASPPRLSYARALRHVSQGGEEEVNTPPPPSAPLTKGPYTPEVNPFFPSSNSDQDKEALMLLRNLNIQESKGRPPWFQ